MRLHKGVDFCMIIVEQVMLSNEKQKQSSHFYKELFYVACALINLIHEYTGPRHFQCP